MPVNYISSPTVISVNTNTVFAENDYYPANIGFPPDGIIDVGSDPFLSRLEFKISPANPATHIVLASDFSFAGLTPNSEITVANYPIVEYPVGEEVYSTTHIKYYVNGASSTNVLGNPQTVTFPPGITGVQIMDSTDTSVFEENPSTAPPTDNEVIVRCYVNGNYPIGSTDISLVLDIDGDARLIPSPYESNELVITCELEGEECNANVVSVMLGTAGQGQSADYNQYMNATGGNYWNWEHIETNDPKIAKIKAICPPNAPNVPIRTFDSFMPFLIRPNDGYLIGRWFCELIDPSTGQEVSCGNQSTRPLLHRGVYGGGSALSTSTVNIVNDQLATLATPFYQQDEIQAILDNYFADYFNVEITNDGAIQPGCADGNPEIFVAPSYGNSSFVPPCGSGWYDWSFFGRTVGCDNPNVIIYTAQDSDITQWASWDYNEEYLYFQNPPYPLGGNDVDNTYFDFWVNNISDLWGPRIDFVDTKQDIWPLIIGSLQQGEQNITIADAVWEAGGTFEGLLGGNGVLVDLKGLDGWANMNSDIREIKIKIKVTNNLITEQNVDTVTWSSSIMIDNT
tara:strand:- start:10433 stop:12139 length:1707 start_codon:yes stop_codon:yes gene_type:complete